jgi:PGF-pre-PGF domain-containing protein
MIKQILLFIVFILSIAAVNAQDEIFCDYEVGTNQLDAVGGNLVTLAVDSTDCISRPLYFDRVDKPKTISQAQIWNELPPNERVTGFEVETNDIPITEISFIPEIRLTDVELQMSASDLPFRSRPPLSSELTPYSYLELILTSAEQSFFYIDSADEVSDKAIMQANIGFSIERNWLQQQGATADDVTFLSYQQGEWMSLPVMLTGTNMENLYFESVIPNFGYAAIAVEKPGPVSSDSIIGYTTRMDQTDVIEGFEFSCIYELREEIYDARALNRLREKIRKNARVNKLSERQFRAKSTTRDR